MKKSELKQRIKELEDELFLVLTLVRHRRAAHSPCLERSGLLPSLPDRGRLLADRALSRLLRSDCLAA